jgi:hypothetical protein
MAEEKKQNPVQTFLDDEDRKSRYEAVLAEIKKDLQEIEAELDDCQRLTEADFLVRINARG